MTAAQSIFADIAERNFPPGSASGLSDLGALAPVIAGARARGLADAFELMGTAAILLSEFGSVLHVGASANTFLGDAVSVASSHLVAETAKANRDLEYLIAAISGMRDLHPVVIPRQDAPAIEIRAIRLADAANDPMQLLKAILVLREVPPSA